MKFSKLNRSALCGMMAMLLVAFSAFSPLGVKGENCDSAQHDMDMLNAFWHQEAYDGLINGEAVYDGIPESHGSPSDEYGSYLIIYFYETSYGGGWNTCLVNFGGFGLDSLDFSYSVDYASGFYDPITEGYYCADGWFDIKPDLYGDLDLSGTKIAYLDSPDVNQTHISSVNLNDCERIGYAIFNNQPFCTEFSALNCPELYKVDARDCAYKNIAFQPRAYTEPLMISTFGCGTVGAYYEQGVSRDTATLYAKAEDGDFLGWFVNGSLVSTEYEYVHEGGGEVIACFAGDANGDGRITVSDATTTARYALSLIEAQSTLSMMDANANGVIEIADAVMIARFALGV